MELNTGCGYPVPAIGDRLAGLQSYHANETTGSTAADFDPSRVLEQLFECPSSNERNTNTLLSGSESDAVKTPSVGSDSPGFCLQDVAAVYSGGPPAAAAAVQSMSCSSGWPLHMAAGSPSALPMCSPPVPPQTSCGPLSMPPVVTCYQQQQLLDHFTPTMAHLSQPTATSSAEHPSVFSTYSQQLQQPYAGFPSYSQMMCHQLSQQQPQQLHSSQNYPLQQLQSQFDRAYACESTSRPQQPLQSQQFTQRLPSSQLAVTDVPQSDSPLISSANSTTTAANPQLLSSATQPNRQLPSVVSTSQSLVSEQHSIGTLAVAPDVQVSSPRRPARSRPTSIRGRPPKLATRTYRSQMCDDLNPLKLTIRLDQSSNGPSSLPPFKSPACSSRQMSARGRRRRRRSRVIDSDDDDDVRVGRTRGGVGRRRGKYRRRGAVTGVKTTATSSSVYSVFDSSAGMSSASQLPGEPTDAVPAVEDDADSAADRPQSGWADDTRMPEALLRRIFGALIGNDSDAPGGDCSAVPTLVHVSRVCRLWRRAAADPLLWRCVDLNCSLVPDHQRHVRTLLYLADNRLSLTEELSLAGWQNAFGPAAASLLCDKCTRLQSLCLSGCRSCLTSDTLLELCRRLPALNQLDLSDVQPSSSMHRAPLCVSVVQEMCNVMGDRLRAFNISHNCVTGIPAVVEILAAKCVNLELLDLSNMQSQVRDVVAINIERLQTGCTKMRVLRWTNTKLKLADATIKEQISSGGFPELEELSVAVPKGAGWGVDDAGLERLLKSSRRLLLLDVRGCERITDASLVRVPAWHLQELHVSGTQAGRLGTESRLELLIRKWRRSLRELDLSWASHQVALNAAFSALVEGGGDKEGALQLRRLLLTGCAVSFEPVARVIMAAPQLHHVDLTSCRSLPRGVKRPHVGAVQLASLREQIRHGRLGDVFLL